MQAWGCLQGHLPAVPLGQAAGRAAGGRLPEILAPTAAKVAVPGERRRPLPQGQSGLSGEFGAFSGGRIRFEFW